MPQAIRSEENQSLKLLNVRVLNMERRFTSTPAIIQPEDTRRVSYKALLLKPNIQIHGCRLSLDWGTAILCNHNS